VAAGFTASKILWLQEAEPENYERLATILLPHDYLNFRLTGERRAEYGDASGTAFFDVRRRRWSQEVLAAIDDSGRPLLKAEWAGVVDTVGGEMLATAIKKTKLHGSVTCCGNVASADLPLTVYPFILRGVSLLGVDSQNCPMDVRRHLWEKMANEWRIDGLDRLTQHAPLSELSGHIDEILAGKKKGRTVVELT